MSEHAHAKPSPVATTSPMSPARAATGQKAIEENVAVARLRQVFADVDFQPQTLQHRHARSKRESGQVAVIVPAQRLIDVMLFLRDDPITRLDFLSDLTCVDYLRYPVKLVGIKDRFAVTYTLLSTEHGHRLWVKCMANDPQPSVPSVTPVWSGAIWQEREVWDMFGVRFVGHPDLRRILTWEGFPNFPLRKDYPLRGRGERENYDVVSRTSA